jgi:hypothetical protein
VIFEGKADRVAFVDGDQRARSFAVEGPGLVGDTLVDLDVGHLGGHFHFHLVIIQSFDFDGGGFLVDILVCRDCLDCGLVPGGCGPVRVEGRSTAGQHSDKQRDQQTDDKGLAHPARPPYVIFSTNKL